MSERIFIDIIQAACRYHLLDLNVRSGGWLLELSKNGINRYILGTNLGLNSQVSAAIAKDKVAASVLLAGAGISHIPHFLLKSRDDSQIDSALLSRMLAQSAVVIKPLEGSHGEFVTRVESVKDANVLVAETGIQSWAVSPMYVIDYEIRIVVVDAGVRLVHKKINPVMRRGLPSFNLSSGATAEHLRTAELSPELADMAIAATTLLGLRTAAVDIAVNPGGEAYIVEVNAAYSLMYYASTNEAAYNETASFYSELIAGIFK